MSLEAVLEVLPTALAQQRWAIVGSVADAVRRRGALPRRPGGDLDLAVRVDGLADFLCLRDGLACSLGAVLDPSLPFRLHRAGGLAIDLVPCGPIERDGRVALGVRGLRPLRVHGFDDAIATARPVVLMGGALPVASLPALIGLRLLAWRASPGRRDKDLAAMERLVLHGWRDGNWRQRCGDAGRAVRTVFSAPALRAMGQGGDGWRGSWRGLSRRASWKGREGDEGPQVREGREARAIACRRACVAAAVLAGLSSSSP